MESYRNMLLTRRPSFHAATAAALAVAVSLLEACTPSAITPTLPESPQAPALPRPATPALPPTLAPAPATATPVSTSQAAAAYLHDALDYIAQHSVMRDGVDWEQLRDDATTLSQDARKTADTYPAIRFVLRHLGDHHSAFFTPDQWQTLQRASASGLGMINKGRVIVTVFPSSPAARAGGRVRDVIAAINGTPVGSASAN